MPNNLGRMLAGNPAALPGMQATPSPLSEALGVDPAANLPGMLQPGQVTDEDLLAMQAFLTQRANEAQPPSGPFRNVGQPPVEARSLHPAQAMAARLDPTSLSQMLLRGPALGGSNIVAEVDRARATGGAGDFNPADVLSVLPAAGATQFAMGPSGALGIFGGRLAKQAPSHRETAEKALSLGADPQQTHKLTGWFRGADGKMRFEIDDSQALTTSKFADDITKVGPNFRPLASALNHPELFDQYPALRKIGVIYKSDMSKDASSGSFDPAAGIINLNTFNRSPAQIKSTLLHEIQHAVQEMEEFARGGNPEQIAEMLRARGRSDLAEKGYESYEGYRRLAGEVEARAVQAREPMTAELRARSLPVQPPTAPATYGVGPHGMYAEDMPRRMQVVVDRAGNTRRAVEAGERKLSPTDRAAILRGDLL